jgi:endonuclease-8
MPEGDTIHYLASRIGPVLAGHVPDEIATPHPRFGRDHWPERLAGRAVTGVDAYGKHLFVRFEDDLLIHSHLRMSGWWHIKPRRVGGAWLVLRRGDTVVTQVRGPVLELMTASRARFDQRIAALGPDIVADDFDEQRFLKRLRADDPTRGIGDALLDQQTVAGIGNFWKSEGCFAAGIDPWRPTGRVSDEEALAIIGAVRPGMRQAARDGNQTHHATIYRRAERPCPRCGGRVRARGQGDDNRITFWCEQCQR